MTIMESISLSVFLSISGHVVELDCVAPLLLTLCLFPKVRRFVLHDLPLQHWAVPGLNMQNSMTQEFIR